MPNIAEIYSPEIKNQYFDTAVVVEDSDTQGFIRVNLMVNRENYSGPCTFSDTFDKSPE